MDFRKTIDWYNQNAEQYAINSQEVFYDDAAKLFLAKLPENPQVLEAGCGEGRDAALLTRSGAKVIGLDLSTGLLEVARRQYPEIEFIEGNLLALPFNDQQFDGVWAHASLVHLETLEDVQSVMREFNRVLKTNGTLYLYVKKQTGESDTAVVADSLSQHERFFRYYTDELLRNLLSQHGFTVSSIETKADKHGRPEVIWLEVFAVKS